MSEIVIGLDGNMYFGVAGTTPSKIPANLMGNVSDATCTLTNTMAEITRRSGGGKKAYKPTTQEISISCTVFNAPDDPDVAALKASAINRTPIAIFAEEETDSEGPNGDFYVESWPRKEAIEDAQSFEVVLKPTDELRAPTWDDGAV